MNIKYSDAIDLMENGDILLFRGKGLVSWLIKTYSHGEYSHVAILDMSEKIPMCCEMREFKGGRCVSLETQVKGSSIIDVFRPVGEVTYDQTNSYVDPSDEQVKYNVSKITKRFTDEVKNNIVLRIMKMSGTDYGWLNIISMVKHYIPIFRLLKPKTQDDEERKLHVCSTAVSYCLRKEYEDPVPFLPDHMVTPSDLSRSPLLKYQFTIEKE